MSEDQDRTAAELSPWAARSRWASLKSQPWRIQTQWQPWLSGGPSQIGSPCIRWLGRRNMARCVYKKNGGVAGKTDEEAPVTCVTVLDLPSAIRCPFETCLICSRNPLQLRIRWCSAVAKRPNRRPNVCGNAKNMACKYFDVEFPFNNYFISYPVKK